MDSAIAIIFQLAVLIFSVVIHEVSHGLAANALGDPTAKYAGRLTLNPMSHLDPLGSFLVPLMTYVIPQLFGGSGFIMGWARPVPYNPNYFRMRNRDLGSALVGFAGPAANIGLALIFGLAVRFSPLWAPPGGALGMLPQLFAMIAITNLILAVFNLVPLPPLDGSKLLFALLPPSAYGARAFLEQYSFILLVLFILYFSGWIWPVVLALFRLISGFSP